MEGVKCVKGEVHNVLAVLRLSVRLARESSFFSLALDSSTDDLAALIRSFKDLSEQLGFYSDLNDLSCSAYLGPFLKAVSSTQVPDSVASAALDSLHKFLLYNLLTPESAGVAEGLSKIAECVIGLRTTTRKTSGETQEILSLKAMEILLESLRCKAGKNLTNHRIWQLFQCCYGIRSDRASSPLLCQYVDHFLMQFVLLVFNRLQGLTPVHVTSSESISKKIKQLEEMEKDRPFGVLVMIKLLRLFAAIVNPDDPKNDRDSRELGLRLLNISLETAGSSFGNHSLLIEVVQDEICKRVLQNSQTSHPFVLSLTLRIVFNLFLYVKEHLRVQLEVFFTSIHLRIAESRASSAEQKVLVLESLIEFCHEPSLLVGLYRNYDCEVSSTNLFEDLCKHLTQQAIPAPLSDLSGAVSKSSKKKDAGEINSLHSLAFEAVISILDSLAKRFGGGVTEYDDETAGSLEAVESLEEKSPDRIEGYASVELSSSSKPADERLKLQKQEKQLLFQAAEKFNNGGPKSFKSIQSLGILSDPLTPKSVADFFRRAPGLDRCLVGIYLGMPQEFNQEVLRSYLGTFELGGLRIDEAMRVFLESFILPGEAQIIERIIERFAEKYFQENSVLTERSSLDDGASRDVDFPIASKDAAFVLAYSIIMLNTDAHKKQVHQKMTLDQWIFNNSGINDKRDFPREFLEAIYSSVTQNAMVIQSQSLKDLVPSSSEEGLSLTSGAQWKKLIARSRKAGAFKTSAGFLSGKEMFALIAVPAAQILCFYMERATNSKRLQRIIEGYHAYSRVCSVYGLSEPFNSLIISLSRALSELLEQCSSAYEDPAFAFGKSLRGQRMCVLLFNLLRTYPNWGSGDLLSVLDSWPNVVHCLLWLHHLNLLPPEFSRFDDFRDSEGQFLPSIEKTLADERSKSFESHPKPSSSKGSGFSSFITSLWSSQEEDEEEKETGRLSGDDEEWEWEQIAKECVRSCQIQDLFENSFKSSVDSVSQLVQTLILVSTVSSHSVKVNAIPDSLATSMSLFHSALLTEKTAVFCIERLCTVIDVNRNRLDQFWPILINHFKFVLTHAVASPTYYIERIVFNFMKLCGVLIDLEYPLISEAMEVMQLILRLSEETVDAMAERVVYGIQFILQSDSMHVLKSSSWRSLLIVLHRFSNHKRVGKLSYDCIEYIIQNCITMANFEETFSYLFDILQTPLDASASSSEAIRVLDAMLQLFSNIKNLVAKDRSRKSDASFPFEGLDHTPKSSEEPSLQELWLLSIERFARACRDSREVVSLHAISCLQKALFASGVNIKSSLLWKIALNDILLPYLTSDYEEPSVEKLEIEAKEHIAQPLPLKALPADLKVKICTILCQTVLYNARVLEELEDLDLLWINFLGSLESLMIGFEKSEEVAADVPVSNLPLHFNESVKNAVLFLSSSGVFERYQKATDKDLLTLTFTIIENSHPGLKVELENALMVQSS